MNQENDCDVLRHLLACFECFVSFHCCHIKPDFFAFCSVHSSSLQTLHAAPKRLEIHLYLLYVDVQFGEGGKVALSENIF